LWGLLCTLHTAIYVNKSAAERRLEQCRHEKDEELQRQNVDMLRLQSRVKELEVVWESQTTSKHLNESQANKSATEQRANDTADKLKRSEMELQTLKGEVTRLQSQVNAGSNVGRETQTLVKSLTTEVERLRPQIVALHEQAQHAEAQQRALAAEKMVAERKAEDCSNEIAAKEEELQKLTAEVNTLLLQGASKEAEAQLAESLSLAQARNEDLANQIKQLEAQILQLEAAFRSAFEVEKKKSHQLRVAIKFQKQARSIEIMMLMLERWHLIYRMYIQRLVVTWWAHSRQVSMLEAFRKAFEGEKKASHQLRVAIKFQKQARSIEIFMLVLERWHDLLLSFTHRLLLMWWAQMRQAQLTEHMFKSEVESVVSQSQATDTGIRSNRAAHICREALEDHLLEAESHIPAATSNMEDDKTQMLKARRSELLGKLQSFGRLSELDSPRQADRTEKRGMG